jgi:hypothetical protein
VSPYDDPHVSAGEIADYLFTYKTLLMATLNQPNTSTPIIRPQTIGTVHCINIAKLGQPQQLRYFGASAVCGASGQAHPTQAQAEADIIAWADGKSVPYVQHAVVPKAGMFSTSACSPSHSPSALPTRSPANHTY